MTLDEMFSVSVVVPAYNAASTLGTCLAALRKQAYPRELYRIIVVDDGSTDDTAQVAESFGVKVIRQKNQGASAARNAGLREATSDIVLFTDSDCEPDDEWIAEMVKPFSDPEVVGAKGFYKTKQTSLIARFAQVEYEMKCSRLRELKCIDFVDTYSAAYRRERLLEAGGFDTSYTTASAEDAELSYRLSSQGCKLVPAPGAFVYHQHPDSLLKYLRKKYRNAYWRAFTWQKHPSKIMSDSHTPLWHKLEVLLAPILLLSLSVNLLGPEGLLPFTLFLALAFFLNERLYFRQVRDDRELALAGPVLLLLRGLTGALGAGVRIWEIWTGRKSTF